MNLVDNVLSVVYDALPTYLQTLLLEANMPDPSSHASQFPHPSFDNRRWLLDVFVASCCLTLSSELAVVPLFTHSDEDLPVLAAH